MSRGLLRRLTILLLDLFYLAVFVSGAPIVASKAPAMPPSLPGSSFVWMLALWALSPRNIRLVSAVPSTVVVDNQDPRIQYTPAEQWFRDPSNNWRGNLYNGSHTWTYGASATFRFSGLGISITSPTSPDQALRMILLNNVSMGTCDPESPESAPPTSFFSKDLEYGDHIVEVRHIDTRPNRILTIDTFRVIVDNDLYPTASGLNSSPPGTILSASGSANQSSDPSDPPVGFSPSIVALIITLPLLFFCLVCPILTCLWIRRRHRHSRRESTNTSEKALEPEQAHSRHNTSSNLSEFDIEALTIQEQSSAPPIMGPMTAAMLDARGVVSTPSSRRRQLANTISSGSAASGSAAGYPTDVSPQVMHTADHTTTSDEHPVAFPAGNATPPPPLGDRTERRRSRSPTAFFSRLSHNFTAAFRGNSSQGAGEVDGDTDETSTAESWSTPMALGVRLNHQPTATAASSTLHGSDSEASGKGKWLRHSIGSYSGEGTRAPSFSSHASFGHPQGGHSQGQGGLRRGDQSPSHPLDTVNDVSPPGTAQSGELSVSSASTGMMTALTHQTMDVT